MTAIEKYIRLESLAGWKECITKSEREVIVSFGKESLIISDLQDVPITHWSLDSTRIISSNPKQSIFSPDPDGMERLYVSDKGMIDAIMMFTKELETPTAKKNHLILFFILFWILTSVVVGGSINRDNIASKVISKTREAQIISPMSDEFMLKYGPVCHFPKANDAMEQFLSQLGSKFEEITVQVLSKPKVGLLHFPTNNLIISEKLLKQMPNPASLETILTTVYNESIDRVPLKKILRDQSSWDILKFIFGIQKHLSISSISILDLIPEETNPFMLTKIDDHSWVTIQNICTNKL